MPQHIRPNIAKSCCDPPASTTYRLSDLRSRNRHPGIPGELNWNRIHRFLQPLLAVSKTCTPKMKPSSGRTKARDRTPRARGAQVGFTHSVAKEHHLCLPFQTKQCFPQRATLYCIKDPTCHIEPTTTTRPYVFHSGWCEPRCFWMDSVIQQFSFRAALLPALPPFRPSPPVAPFHHRSAPEVPAQAVAPRGVSPPSR